MQPTDIPPAPDQGLWAVIRNGTDALSFERYQQFIDPILSGTALTPRSDPGPDNRSEFAQQDVHNQDLPFPDIESYRLLKVASDVFMMAHCGSLASVGFTGPDLDDQARWVGNADTPEGHSSSPSLRKQLETFSNSYLRPSAATNGVDKALPLLWNVIRLILGGIPNQDEQVRAVATQCYAILKAKVTYPCFLELLWNYWLEEGMLVQSMNAIIWRFQNRRKSAGDDPLAILDTDPLRPLNNLLWGWVQDEQRRLTLRRRSYEYDHEYGLRLTGRAVPQAASGESRSRFLKAFHNLLHLCMIFFRQDDDTTTVADGFPVLSALRDVHRVLSEGAHNQYGDLPWAARQEFLMMEWMLARSEMREFLPSRTAGNYPEPWMDLAQTMKAVQGWTGTSILQFRDLGIFAERIVLSARYGLWTNVTQPDSAVNWARYWRPEIQGYVHAYQAATGVDLTRHPDATPPSILLRQQTLSGRLAPACPPDRWAHAIGTIPWQPCSTPATSRSISRRG